MPKFSVVALREATTIGLDRRFLKYIEIQGESENFAN